MGDRGALEGGSILVKLGTRVGLVAVMVLGVLSGTGDVRRLLGATRCC